MKTLIFTPTAFHTFRPRNTKQLHELRTFTVSLLTELMARKCDTTVFHTDRSRVHREMAGNPKSSPNSPQGEMARKMFKSDH